MSHSNSRRLYLRGLRKDVTEQELFKFLSCYGRITEVKLLTNYAFVQFESEMDASIVLETYQTQPLLGKKVVIEYSHPLRKDIRPSSNSITDHRRLSSNRDFHRRYPVIVIDIPHDVCWQNLKDFGRSSGQMVAFCDLDRTQKGRGFIEYFTKEDAKTAARVLDGKYLGGRPVRQGCSICRVRVLQNIVDRLVVTLDTRTLGIQRLISGDFRKSKATLLGGGNLTAHPLEFLMGAIQTVTAVVAQSCALRGFPARRLNAVFILNSPPTPTIATSTMITETALIGDIAGDFRLTDWTGIVNFRYTSFAAPFRVQYTYDHLIMAFIKSSIVY